MMGLSLLPRPQLLETPLHPLIERRYYNLDIHAIRVRDLYCIIFGLFLLIRALLRSTGRPGWSWLSLIVFLCLAISFCIMGMAQFTLHSYMSPKIIRYLEHYRTGFAGLGGGIFFV